MNLRTYLIAMLLLANVVCFSQYQQEMPSNCSSYQYGTVFLSNGESFKTYILMDFCNPHSFQYGLQVINEKTFKRLAKGKKVKSKAYEAIELSTIDGFLLASGQRFQKETFALNQHGIQTKQQLVEVVITGEVAIFKKYYSTNDEFVYRSVLQSKLQGGQEHLRFMVNNFEVYYKKGNEGRLHNIRNANLTEVFGDNLKLLKKYQAGVYTFKSEFKRPVTFSANCDLPFLESLLVMVNDYNKKSLDSYTDLDTRF
ncbi:hypothetical protein [Croceivirga lutea]|uniref:hypothetical protein n=1 Tax=Croceivirga lutea TaxID=1775167 RepID=UPI001639AA4C|nr:hypothetical protein [Croceivirga lutea]